MVKRYHRWSVPGKVGAWIDRRSPLARHMTHTLWLNWLFLLTIGLYSIFIPGFALAAVMKAEDSHMPLFMMFMCSWNVGAFLPHAVHRTRMLLSMPVSRRRVFSGILGPALVCFMGVGVLVTAIAPLTVRPVWWVIRDGEARKGSHGWPRRVESPEEFAQQQCREIRQDFGVTVRPDEILKVDEDASVVDLAPVLGRLRWARTRLTLCTVLTAMLTVMTALLLVLPGRKAYRSPRAMALMKMVLGVGGLLFMALWFLPLAFEGLRDDFSLCEAHVRAFLVGNFWIVAPVMLVACVLLWVRNRRAFRYAEIVSPIVRWKRS